MSAIPSAVSPESLGIPCAALADLVRETDDLGALDTLHTLTVLRHGQTALSMAWAPFDLDSKHLLHSCSKSFTSLAVGFAQAEGRLDIDTPFLNYLPAYTDAVTDPRMRRVTLRHLLTMATGHTVDPTELVAQPGGAQAWCRAFVSSPLQQEPGSVFTYNSLATYMQAAVVREVTGLNVREYLMPRLFEPLGILPGLWECCPDGINLGGWGFMLSANDLVKFGQCLLQRGTWNGRQILPPDYLAAATKFQMDNSTWTKPDSCVGYGFQFWMNQHGFRADGAFGQLVVVVPEDDLVVVTTGCADDIQHVLTAIWKMRARFAARPLPEDAAALAQLRELCATRVIRPFAARPPSTPPSAPAQSAAYHGGGWQVMVDVQADECKITFLKSGHYEQLCASFAEPLGTASVLQLDDVTPHPYRAVAHWETPRRLVITAVAMDTGWVDQYVADLGDGGQLVRNATFALGLGWHHSPTLTWSRSGRPAI